MLTLGHLLATVPSLLLHGHIRVGQGRGHGCHDGLSRRMLVGWSGRRLMVMLVMVPESAIRTITQAESAPPVCPVCPPCHAIKSIDDLSRHHWGRTARRDWL